MLQLKKTEKRAKSVVTTDKTPQNFCITNEVTERVAGVPIYL